MRYYRRVSNSGDSILLVADQETVYDLTSATEELSTFLSLARAARVMGTSLDSIARRHLSDALTLDSLPDDVRMPLRPQEVWAAGVTYKISEEARESESKKPDFYIDVYDADRPELFFKATPSRLVGPGEAIATRTDSSWDVPEPELGLVLYRGEVIGYTIGNDVSSRDIEGENPLYLPQAKVYDRCCSIGPCVTSTESVEDPYDLGFSLRIHRDDETVFSDSANTGEMVRTHESLVQHLRAHNTLPRLCVLLTGTPIVPSDGFSLAEGDKVVIEIDEIGTLVNPVTVV